MTTPINESYRNAKGSRMKFLFIMVLIYSDPLRPPSACTSPKSDMEILIDIYSLYVGFGGGREGVELKLF